MSQVVDNTELKTNELYDLRDELNDILLKLPNNAVSLTLGTNPYLSRKTVSCEVVLNKGMTKVRAEGHRWENVFMRLRMELKEIGDEG